MKNQDQAIRSGFVTVIAWIFIILSGLTILSSLVQLVLFSYVFPAAHIQQAMQATMHEYTRNAPALTRFMSGHMRLFNMLFLIFSSAMFIISIALLKRKGWARIAFIEFLALGVIWELVNLVIKLNFLGHMSQLPNNMPAQFQSIQEASLVFSVILAAVLGLFFAWVIKRMLSAKTEAEFADK